MRYSTQYSLVFGCDRSGNGDEDWVAVGRTVPGISAHGATPGAAVCESTSVALRVIAELVAKGDAHWARFKEEDK